jgi:hypothetical protein
MASPEFIALDHGLRISSKKLPAPELSSAGSGCIRNPRAVGRSGCTPAEPYPPNRKSEQIRKNLKKSSLQIWKLTNHIPVHLRFDCLF